MDEEDRSAEEAKRRVVIWVLSAVSGVAATVSLSLGYWLVSVSIEARDHGLMPHVSKLEHIQAEQAARQRIEADLKEIEARLIKLENGK